MLTEFIALLNDPDAFIAMLQDGELCVEPERELETKTLSSAGNAAGRAAGRLIFAVAVGHPRIAAAGAYSRRWKLGPLGGNPERIRHGG